MKAVQRKRNRLNSSAHNSDRVRRYRNATSRTSVALIMEIRAASSNSIPRWNVAGFMADRYPSTSLRIRSKNSLPSFFDHLSQTEAAACLKACFSAPERTAISTPFSLRVVCKRSSLVRS